MFQKVQIRQKNIACIDSICCFPLLLKIFDRAVGLGTVVDIASTMLAACPGASPKPVEGLGMRAL